MENELLSRPEGTKEEFSPSQHEVLQARRGGWRSQIRYLSM